VGTIFGTGPWNTQIGLADQTLTCWVPQESVFGPLLWNLAYNPPHRPSCRLQLVYYADDTLIVAGGEIGLVATMRAEIVVEKMRRIREIDLEMTLNKWKFSSSTMRAFGARLSPTPYQRGISPRRDGSQIKILGAYPG